MIQRVTYPKYVNRRRYDELKIGIQEKWKTFRGFFEDMWEGYEAHVIEHGEKFTTLDRIDNRKGYQKDNCRWTTPTQQARNRRSNLVFRIDGEDRCLQELVEGTGVLYATAWARIKKLGWSVEDAIKK